MRVGDRVKFNEIGKSVNASSKLIDFEGIILGVGISTVKVKFDNGSRERINSKFLDVIKSEVAVVKENRDEHIDNLGEKEEQQKA